ncbi:MAG: hypothetical protein FWG72_04405 [Oscillospiraceae bacterium]|nr:hypothetical protein [Oscillospiraceae bacterium]
MFCSNCGGKNIDGASFCNSCGSRMGQFFIPPSPPSPPKPRRTRAPGEGFLIAAGVLYLVIGTSRLFVGAWTYSLLVTASSIVGYDEVQSELAGASFFAVMTLFLGIWNIVMGIVGLIKKTAANAAKRLQKFATIDIIATIIFILVNFLQPEYLGYTSAPLALIALFTGVAYFGVPYLYITGAKKNEYASARARKCRMPVSADCISCGYCDSNPHIESQ